MRYLCLSVGEKTQSLCTNPNSMCFSKIAMSIYKLFNGRDGSFNPVLDNDTLTTRIYLVFFKIQQIYFRKIIVNICIP